MSLINTNYDYLATMGISEESPMVGIIVSVYYLGCAAGAVVGSAFSNAKGRRPAIFATIATAAVGNLIMFMAGLKGMPGAQATMLLGRIVMGLGVGEFCPYTSKPALSCSAQLPTPMPIF